VEDAGQDEEPFDGIAVGIRPGNLHETLFLKTPELALGRGDLPALECVTPDQQIVAVRIVRAG